MVSTARVIGQFWLLLLLTACGQAQPIDNAAGNWKIFHGGGEPIFVQLRPGGVAHCRGADGTHGTWKLVDGCLILSWQDGWRDIIVWRGNSYRKLGYAPGHPLQGPADHETAAYRRP